MPLDPKDMSAEQAITEWAKVNAEIEAWNARFGLRPGAEAVSKTGSTRRNVVVGVVGVLGFDGAR
jgi:hypothetical protein